MAVASQFWWQLPWGETTCKSLIELKDGKLDMLLPDDSAEAYENVCSQLGYDAMGTPASEDDALKFEEYRQSGELGPVIVASVLRPCATHVKCF